MTKRWHRCDFCDPKPKEEKMEELIFDIETDGLDPTVIHCLVIMDTATGKYRRYSHEAGDMRKGLEALANAKVLIGHNIIGFDLVAIRSLHPDYAITADIKDTLVYTRLIWSNLRELDHQKKWGDTGATAGSHSLEAWGLRLGFKKYTEVTEDKSIFDKWSKELEDYCVRDVEVNHRLWQEIQKHELDRGSVALEHKFTVLMEDMSRWGFLFDRRKADQLYARLSHEKQNIEDQLKDVFPPKVIERYSEKTGRRLKDKVEVFNPGSRKQIAERFQEKGWVPQDFTPDGRPKISETILRDLGSTIPEALVLMEYLICQKKIGQLAEGDNSLLGLCQEDDRIHGRVIGNGTISGRCSHHSPNLAQIPADEDFRSLFIVPDGCSLVGCDASGLELRCLAHYMHQWDSGAYARQILEGDIHAQNMEAAGLSDRAQAKTLIYALIYGAGDTKLGEIVDGGMKEGRTLRRRFMDRTPALKRLTEAVKHKAKNDGYLTGLDGRKLYCRSQHSALNLLLQSAGAVLMKTATCLLSDRLSKACLSKPEDWALVAMVHDEIQVECLEGCSDAVALSAENSISASGLVFDFNIPLSADSHIGKNWWDTH